MSLNLKSLLKKPQRSSFRTPFKSPSQSSSPNSSSSSFKIPPLSLSISPASRKRSSKSLSPDSQVLPPQKVLHQDVEVEARVDDEEKGASAATSVQVKDDGGVGEESQEAVGLPLPPSPVVTPVTRARESPGWSGDTTHVSDTPSWGPSPSHSVSVDDTSQLPELEEKKVLSYQGGANFEMDLSDLDKEYPINPEPEPEPEKYYGNIDEEDFFEDCEEDYLPASQQELVTPTEQSRVSMINKYLIFIYLVE